MYVPRGSNSPPPYQPRDEPASETTPLVRQSVVQRETRVKWTMVTLIGCVFVLLTISLIFFVPYLQIGIAVERRKWERELRQHRLDEQSRMEKWERQFKQRQEQERLREEEWQREEEHRERLGLYWGMPEAMQCTAYNTRDYKARLMNTVPYRYNWLKPCEEIPIVIHNRSILTTRCETYQNGLGEVYGHWRVDFDEPLCAPYWDQFKDKGCIAEGSHRRRIEAHLENIHQGEDGEKLCASRPHDFYGRHFDHPDSCANWEGHGIFGIWDIEDPNC